ncbi:Uncharacterised protein [Candidatus Tiddalikarchaeum anstoanum]|nr:Uncharacterised protein [Candidatus Tiddalikarchaeum anstoanum]
MAIIDFLNVLYNSQALLTLVFIIIVAVFIYIGLSISRTAGGGSKSESQNFGKTNAVIAPSIQNESEGEAKARQESANIRAYLAESMRIYNEDKSKANYTARIIYHSLFGDDNFQGILGDLKNDLGDKFYTKEKKDTYSNSRIKDYINKFKTLMSISYDEKKKKIPKVFDPILMGEDRLIIETKDDIDLLNNKFAEILNTDTVDFKNLLNNVDDSFKDLIKTFNDKNFRILYDEFVLDGEKYVQSYKPKMYDKDKFLNFYSFLKEYVVNETDDFSKLANDASLKAEVAAKANELKTSLAEIKGKLSEIKGLEDKDKLVFNKIKTTLNLTDMYLEILKLKDIIGSFKDNEIVLLKSYIEQKVFRKEDEEIFSWYEGLEDIRQNFTDISYKPYSENIDLETLGIKDIDLDKLGLKEEEEAVTKLRFIEIKSYIISELVSLFDTVFKEDYKAQLKLIFAENSTALIESIRNLLIPVFTRNELRNTNFVDYRNKCFYKIAEYQTKNYFLEQRKNAIPETDIHVENLKVSIKDEINNLNNLKQALTDELGREGKTK